MIIYEGDDGYDDVEGPVLTLTKKGVWQREDDGWSTLLILVWFNSVAVFVTKHTVTRRWASIKIFLVVDLILSVQWEFLRIANNQFPANPLIKMIEVRNGEIFKVRNPIRNFLDE
jgi:hypothetical protein